MTSPSPFRWVQLGPTLPNSLVRSRIAKPRQMDRLSPLLTITSWHDHIQPHLLLQGSFQNAIKMWKRCNRSFNLINLKCQIHLVSDIVLWVHPLLQLIPHIKPVRKTGIIGIHLARHPPLSALTPTGRSQGLLVKV